MMHETLRMIKKSLSLAKFRAKWRKKNKHNSTFPNNLFPIDAVKVGRNTYADLNIYSYRNPDEELTIGNFCSIASDVIFILSGEHRYDCVSTFPFGEKIYKETISAQCRGPIVVCDDVWIGVRCTILSGVTIGQGAIIGANSIVSKDVPPYSIFIGDHVAKKRFSDEIIEKLMTIDFSKLSNEHFENLHKYYDVKINMNNVNEILNCFPKKHEKE